MNAKRKLLLEWLDQQPDGASWESIKDWIGGGSSAVHSFLGRMRDAGLLAFVGTSSRHGRWHTARHAQTALESFERRRTEYVRERVIRRAEYERERCRRHAAARHAARVEMGLDGKARRLPPAGSEPAAAMAWGEQTPEHRVIRAADAPPIAKRGPASVWELAR